MDNKQFIAALADQCNISVEQSARLSGALTGIISRKCSEIMTVAIPSFGYFIPVKTDEYIARDPATGQAFLYPPCIALRFRPGSMLRNQMGSKVRIADIPDPNQKFTLPHIIEAMVESTEDDSQLIGRYLYAFSEIIKDELRDGRSVRIKRLGTFAPSDGNSSDVINFTPDTSLADTINAPFAMFSPMPVESDIELDDTDDTVLETMAEVHPEVNAEVAADVNAEVAADDAPDEASAIVIEIDSAKTDSPQTVVAQIPEELVTETEIAKEVSHENHISDEPIMAQDTTEQDLCESAPIWRHSKAPLFLFGLAIGLLVGVCIGYLSHDHFGKITQSSDSTTVNQSQQATLPPATDVLPESTVTPIDTEEIIDDNTNQSKPEIYDTISSNRFLTTMARRHYGHKNYWVYIYKANPKLGHPDRIKPGTIVLIPDEAQFRQATDSATMAEAIRLSAQIYRSYRH